jgi:hypothetical protein
VAGANHGYGILDDSQLAQLQIFVEIFSPSERDCLFAYPSMTTVSRNATTKMDLQLGGEGRLSAG